MLKNHSKIKRKGMLYLKSYSQGPIVLPYDYYACEDCLRQFSNMVERRLKRE